MRTDELDFQLPVELIAQSPTADRSAARLMHYRRSSKSVEHRTFSDLPTLLGRGDLLVFNDARVIPARLELLKETGGRVEGLYLGETSPGQWRVLLRDIGTARVFSFQTDPTIELRVLGSIGMGEHEVQVSSNEPAAQLLERVGRMPLPPYIRREKVWDERDGEDRDNYQTVYARRTATASVAAPTAGLHFTPELLAELDSRGIQRTQVTLDVGMGTFKPVTAERLEDHPMHVERYDISAPAADALNSARAEGRRIVAVGTTSARVLESYDKPRWEPCSGSTGIFIRPPYAWRHVGALVTNFHLPRSTLIALVAAMVGIEEQRQIYQLAIDEKYRFFSYGDAMLID